MTTIAPALGHGPITQQGIGSTPGYDAVDLRRATDVPSVGEGVTSYGSYRVSQRGAGANMSIDVNQDDYAYVRGDAVTLQALYKIAPHSATINESISTAHATLPRIDQVVLEIKDTQHDASGSSLAQTRVIAGTASSGATLDNRTGVAALPSSALLLADVLVAATDTSISDAEIRDRRPFATGVIPPLLTDVDMVGMVPPFNSVPSLALSAYSDLAQGACLCYLPRRIASATKIRWRYVQGATAATGNYVLAVFDASGRKIIDTGTVAFTGANNSIQNRSETIAATTFEAGAYYVFLGVDTSAGSYTTPGINIDTPSIPNVLLYSTTGGVTVPSAILGFTDANATATNSVDGVPFVALSVG